MFNLIDEINKRIEYIISYKPFSPGPLFNVGFDLAIAEQVIFLKTLKNKIYHQEFKQFIESDSALMEAANLIEEARPWYGDCYYSEDEYNKQFPDDDAKENVLKTMKEDIKRIDRFFSKMIEE